MRQIVRRQFLQDSAAMAAGLAALGAQDARAEDAPASRKAGPNDTVRVAVIGRQGAGHGRTSTGSPSRRTPGSRPSATSTGMSSARRRRRSPSAAGPSRSSSRTCAGSSTTRRSTSSRSPRPNHWHALAAIWACQAGKDVYVEKPVSHNVVEGRRMVEAARKYDRVVQTGTQSRSHQGMPRTRSSSSARASSARSTWPRGSATSRAGRSGTRPTPRCPPGVDYNLWLGPAPERPFNPNRFHYDWHWFWDTATATSATRASTRWTSPAGAWARNRARPSPVQASAAGSATRTTARPRTPSSCTFEYDDCLLQFEVRGLPTNDEKGVRVGNLFYGTEGDPGDHQLHELAHLPRPQGRAGPRRQGRRRPLRQLHRGRQGPRARVAQRPTSRKATSPAPTATWATSPTGSAASSRSTRRPSRSSTTPRPTRC